MDLVITSGESHASACQMGRGPSRQTCANAVPKQIQTGELSVSLIGQPSFC